MGEDDLKCKEVKRIVEALRDKNHYEPVNISTIMPPDRKRRYKVLHHNLQKQSPLRLGLWTFDNYGKSPQSVFIFLVRLEEDFNSILNNVKTIRPGLLAQQQIFFPREFFHQFKHFSCRFVNISSSPMRILLNMI